MKQLHLAVAVFSATRPFIEHNDDFSARDIVEFLRAQCNDGNIEVKDVARHPADGYQMIEYPEVKAILEEFYQEGAFNGYSYRTIPGGGYRKYFKNKAQNVIDINSPDATTQGAVAQSSADFKPLSIQSVVDYVRPSINIGNVVTVKTLQSRFKSTPKTCEEWTNILASNGFGIALDVEGYHSKNTIFSYPK